MDENNTNFLTTPEGMEEMKKLNEGLVAKQPPITAEQIAEFQAQMKKYLKQMSITGRSNMKPVSKEVSKKQDKKRKSKRRLTNKSRKLNRKK
jgi:DNA-binding protein H-NS